MRLSLLNLKASMAGKSRADIVYKIIISLFVSLFIIMLFANIGNRVMFIDEAITAMLGKNTMTFGYPLVWDGKNLITASVNGNEFNESLVYIKHNWLPYYISAFVQVFTTNVAVIRSIFACFGVLSLFLYKSLLEEISDNKIFRMIGFAVFTFSIPVTLYFRSIYYTGLGLTFSISTILLYIRTIKYNKRKDYILLCVSLILLFHSLYLFYFINATALFLSYIIFDFNKTTFKKYFTVGFISALLTLPWYFYSRLYLNKVEVKLSVGAKYFDELIFGYLWQLHAYFIPFLSLLIIYVIIKVLNIHSRDKSIQNSSIRINNLKHQLKQFLKRYRIPMISLIFILVNLVVISIFGIWLNTRWMIPSIPFIYILLTYILYEFYRLDKYIGVVVAIILIFTNVLNVAPYSIIKYSITDTSAIESFVKPPVPFIDTGEGWNTKEKNLKEFLSDFYMRSYFLDYCSELLSKYNDADKGMVEFLLKYGKPSDKVHLVGYQNEIVAYYTGMKMVNRLDKNQQLFAETFLGYPNARKFEHLTICPYEYCDWIIERNESSKEEIWHNEELFQRIYIKCPQTREWNEIWAHSFVSNYNNDGFYIYKNIINREKLPFDEYSIE